MEMEHINENTIRVMIGHEDLEERGVSFLDLLGNHREIENFFYSILEEVDIEDQLYKDRRSHCLVLEELDRVDCLYKLDSTIWSNWLGTASLSRRKYVP